MWCTTAPTTTLLGCAWVVIRQTQLPGTFVGCILGIRLGSVIEYNALCKYRIKASHRCGCTNPPCGLGDAGSMTLLPCFVPWTEPPVKLREVGPDKRHLLTQRCSDVHVHVCRSLTGDEGCCCCSVETRRRNIIACAGLIFSRQRLLQQRVLQQHRVLRQQVQQQHEQVVIHRKPSDRVVLKAGLYE